MDLTALERSAERLAALTDQVDAERETRNQLIRQAMEDGAGYAEVARAAGLQSTSTVAWIIGS